MLHFMSLAVVVDYEMYLDVSERDLNYTWKDDNIVDFWTFSDILSNQIIRYNLTHCKYAGDANMIPDTQNNQDTIYNSNDAERGK